MFVQGTISYDKTCIFNTLKDKICFHTIFKTLITPTEKINGTRLL